MFIKKHCGQQVLKGRIVKFQGRLMKHGVIPSFFCKIIYLSVCRISSYETMLQYIKCKHMQFIFVHFFILSFSIALGYKYILFIVSSLSFYYSSHLNGQGSTQISPNKLLTVHILFNWPLLHNWNFHLTTVTPSPLQFSCSVCGSMYLILVIIRLIYKIGIMK